MTIEEIITDIIDREGRTFEDDPDDPGRATKYGITAKVLGEVRKLGRDATVDEVRDLTEDEAREIYRWHYIVNPRFYLIGDATLREFIIDSGVNHGRARTVIMLQRLVGTAQDGIFGPKTLAAVMQREPFLLLTAMVRARVMLIAEWMHANKARTKFYGLYTRAVSFLPERVE